MKVGIYTGNINPTEGGGFTYLESIIASFDRLEKYEIILLSYKKINHTTLPLIQLNQPSLFYRIIKKLKNLGKTESVLQTAVRNEGIDLIWFPTYETEEITCAYVMTVWDLQHRKYPFFPEFSSTTWESRELKLQKMLPRSTFVITGTEYGSKEISQLYAVENSKIKILPFITPADCYNNVENLSKQYDIKSPETYFYYPAQIWAHKNHILIFRAIKYLKEKGIEVHLVLTGSNKGNWDYLANWAKENSIHQQVHHMGFVEREQLLVLMSKAKALLFPSLFGPDNIPTLEAMALKTPVITADITGVKDQLLDYATYFDPTNHVELANKMQATLEEPTQTTKLDTAQQFALSLNHESSAEKINKILSEYKILLSTWKI